MQVPQVSYPIDVFTAHYRVSGAWQPRGNQSIYLNNESVETLVVEDATVIPLRPGVELEPVLAPKMYLPKKDAQAIIIGNLNLDDVKPLPRRELLVCLTAMFIMKCYFHMAQEAQLHDAFSKMLPQAFLFVSNLQIASLYAEATGVRANALAAFINKNCVLGYYPPESPSQPG